MRRLITFKNLVAVAILLLVMSQVASWCLLHRANQKIDDMQTAIQLVRNELDDASQQQALSPIPGTNRLYLAELNLTVPQTAATSSIRYGSALWLSGEATNEARLTSTYMTDRTMRVKSCADMVRLKIEAKPNPYSPDQPLYATIALADGRTLQVYASTTKECHVAWQAVSPQDLAEPFKQAASY